MSITITLDEQQFHYLRWSLGDSGLKLRDRIKKLKKRLEEQEADLGSVDYTDEINEQRENLESLELHLQVIIKLHNQLATGGAP